METITVQCPPIQIPLNANLLSMPTFGFKAEHLLKIADWIINKTTHGKFNKCPERMDQIHHIYLRFMELYERAKVKEKQNKEEKRCTTAGPFYFPRLGNKNDQRLFERLEHREKTSRYDRRNHKI